MLAYIFINVMTARLSSNQNQEIVAYFVAMDHILAPQFKILEVVVNIERYPRAKNQFLGKPFHTFPSATTSL